MSQEPLTPTELNAWTALLGVMVWLPATLEARLKAESLSLSEFQALWWLSLSPDGERTMSDLANTASVTPSHLSRIAARLQQRGWITRRPDPQDARCTLASLTGSGRAKVEECLPGYNASLREHVFSRLSKEQVRHLGQIATSIMTSVHPECA